MKKLLLLLFVTISSFAQYCIDPLTGISFTLPQATNIDQAEYNRLCVNLCNINYVVWKSNYIKSYVPHDVRLMIEQELKYNYLQSLNTPTAKRLMSDLDIIRPDNQTQWQIFDKEYWNNFDWEHCN